MSGRIRLRAALSLGAASFCLLSSIVAHADEAAPAPLAEAAGDDGAVAGDSIVVTAAKTTRSATSISGVEIQKLLPGISALKAIETLPGVLYTTADPWGNNEQNAATFIHGFSTNQLGYTMDGIPLGDQSYGNYNGLSPQRALISENTESVTVATGAGDLGTASNSNLGGTIEIYSRDPAKQFGVTLAQTVGSYDTSRTFARVDSGNWGAGNSAYVSVARQRARAWDFNGKQGGWQGNGKIVHEDSTGKLTLYADYSSKVEPNEDGTTYYTNPTTAAQRYTPYKRPYLYPDYTAAKAYVDQYGNTPSADGSNYRNYYSDAQRKDFLAYAKYDWNVSSKVKWSNRIYYHNNDGAGVVAGPLGQSITVIQAYLDPNYATDTHYATNANASSALVAATGGSGYVTRTTEYRIDRWGALSTLTADLGNHTIEVGAWFERNSSSAYRRWYAVDDADIGSSTPYIRPSNPLFTQYGSEIRSDNLQLHIQDNWQVSSKLDVEAGLKTSAQWANGWFTVQPKAGSYSGTVGNLPEGEIDTKRWFLPAIGAKYDFNGSENVYFNVQKNVRQYMTYGGGGASPWSTGSQEAFDYFKENGKPESSWTYEVGLRSHRTFSSNILSGIDTQINYYHVDFSNRLLSVSASTGGLGGGSITGGATSLFNVGGVKTDGVDAALTVHFGQHLSVYNALSYNSSKYQSDYNGNATAGKQVPGSPKWMNKTVVTAGYGPVEAQVTGDYVGSRWATYTNAANSLVPSYFQVNARLAVTLPLPNVPVIQKAQLSLNVTNVFNEKGASSISVSQPTSSYATYPIAPRQWFLTLNVGM